MREEFAGKRVAVVGIARSGIAAAKSLKTLGATAILYDQKSADSLPGIARAIELGIEVRPGGEPIDFGSTDILVVSPGVPKSSPLLAEAQAAGTEIWGEIEAAYRMAVAPILAITGTNGKTTTTVLLGEMLRAAGMRAYIAGNIAAGSLAMPLSEAALLAGPTDVIAAEISSFQLEWISQFRPRIAGLLNITPDHQDRQSWDEYCASKWRIFENQEPGDVAVLSTELSGWPQAAALRSRIVNFERNDLNLRPSAVRLPGPHNFENVLAAAAMASAFGAPLEAIKTAAMEFGGVVHRLETAAEFGGVKYVNNSMCTNEAAFQKSLAALPEPKVVIAGGVYKGGDPSPLAEAARRSAVKKLILLGRSAGEIAEAARRRGGPETEQAGSIADAVRLAQQAAQPGDVVLFAPGCASFDMFRDFEDRGDQFKAAVHRLEAEWAGTSERMQESALCGRGER